MRHQRGEAAVGGGHRRQAAGAAVGVEGVGFGCRAVVIHEAHGADHAGGVAALAEVGVALAVRHGNRHPAAGHAGEEDAGRIEHLDQRQARLEALADVGGKARPRLGTGDDVGQFGKHLAAVTHAEAKHVGPREEGLELIGQLRVERDAARPADAGAQCVAIAEAAAGDQAFEIRQLGAAGLQVGHVDVKGLEARLGEGVGHLNMRVDALLPQDGDARTSTQDCCAFGSSSRLLRLR